MKSRTNNGEALPFKVEYDWPMPKGHQAVQGNLALLRKTLLTMRVGGSFICDRLSARMPYHAARQVGVKITSRRMEDGTLRVWRVA